MAEHDGDKITINHPFGADQDAPGKEPGDETPELNLTDEELVALCKARVCPACDEKGEADDTRLRSLAEMDNFKKRLQREQDEFRKYAAEVVLADLLPVLDNLDLALEHGSKVEACKDVVMGVDMTRKVFLDVVGHHGLKPVGLVGEPFDPERHEAVGDEERDDCEPGTVCGLLQKGYVLKERLIRPARVVVSRAPGQ